MNSVRKLSNKWIVTWVVLTICILFIGYLSYAKRLEIVVFLSSHNDYAPTWSLNYVAVDEGNSTVEIYFDDNHKNRSERMERIKKTYLSIKEKFLDDPESRYRNYTINIYFRNIGDGFAITGISSDSDDIQVHVGMDDLGLSVKTIAEYFPNATGLSLSGVHYDDISEFTNFDHLEYIFFGQRVSQEECDSIQKMFPGCVIDKIKQD